jgi:hypothetical protein
MMTIFCAVLMIALLWLIAENGMLRSENTDLRRAVARPSKHPSTYHEQPLPYMRRYADDEE